MRWAPLHVRMLLRTTPAMHQPPATAAYPRILSLCASAIPSGKFGVRSGRPLRGGQRLVRYFCGRHGYPDGEGITRACERRKHVVGTACPWNPWQHSAPHSHLGACTKRVGAKHAQHTLGTKLPTP